MVTCIISKRFTFEASHVLPRHPGKCSRLHGHSWVLTVSVQGPIDEETGFVVDYGDLSELVNREVISRLDHTHLGQWKAVCSPEGIIESLLLHGQCPFGWNFYPSSENLVVAIGKMLIPLIKEMKNAPRLYETRLEETCTSATIWRPDPESIHPYIDG